MARNVTFAVEATKYRLDNVENWLVEAERVCRETAEALVRQADSCQLAAHAIADYRDMIDDLDELEDLSGGPVRLARDCAS